MNPDLVQFFSERLTEELRLAPNRSEALGIGQKIIDIVKELIKNAVGSLDVEEVLAVAKQFYDQLTAGDNPSIPNILEPFIEQMIWRIVENAIRRLFSTNVGG